MGIADIFNIDKIKSENERLNRIFEDIGGTDIVAAQDNLRLLKLRSEDLTNEIEELNTRYTRLKLEVEGKENEILSIDEQLSLESFALYNPYYEFSSSSEYKARLDEIRQNQKDLIKKKGAAIGNNDWVVNNSKAQGKKLVNDMIKLVIRSFNNECDYCVDNVKFNNIDKFELRIEKSFEALNKLGKIMSVSITTQYKLYKYHELHLAFEYQQKKQEEKEEQKRIRAELREQAKLEQEIRQAREKIEKERKHFNAALKDIDSKIAKATDEDELKILNERKLELENSYEKLNDEESMIDYREKNAKAGYVYIISNVGAFGEGVYKIGMTRRLEPLDRVDELGDASVPFVFDVHALIFSDNAPELESKLHQHFHEGRLNKINNRKEFFRADIKEIEKVIKENYDKVFDLKEFAPAEQYRESLKIDYKN